MATIGRANHASYLNTSRLSYYSAANFYNNFFTYTTSVNAQGTTVGSLSSVSGATLANCPAGRVLRETGRKLYPGANPSINTYMVSVYDAQTQLTGFIDPNSSVFTIYNTDKPNFITDGVDPTANVTDAGMSIYTLGNITAGGFISTASYITSASTITAASGNVVATTGHVTAGTYYNGGVITPAIYYTGYTQLPYNNAAGSNNADVFANPALGNVANLSLIHI